MLLEVEPGSYRAQADQPRTFCEPRAHTLAYSISGLSTDAPEELELRVLPGHVSAAAFMCLCALPSLNHIVVDDASCTFAELGAELPGVALGPDGGSVVNTAQPPDAGAASQPD